MSNDTSDPRTNGSFAGDCREPLAALLDYRSLVSTIEGGLDDALGESWLGQARRLVFAGSGDSLFAARSVLPALRRWSGIAAEVMTGIEFARYETPLLEPGDVLVAISNSGGSSRTREAVALTRARGIPVLGVTGSLDGPLASMVDRTVHRPVRSTGFDVSGHRRAIVHMAEYFATLRALYGLALRLGLARGRLAPGDAAELRAAIDRAVGAVPEVAAATEAAARALAERFHASGTDTVWVLGAGPNRGTAEYCAAKFHEQVPLNGVPQDLEEWAHLQYFLTLSWGERGPVLVLAPPGNARDRAEEIVAGIARAGGFAVTVGPGEAAGTGARLEVAEDLPELLTPLLYHVPVQLLVLHLARLVVVDPTPIRRVDDYELIRGGIVRDRVEGLS